MNAFALIAFILVVVCAIDVDHEDRQRKNEEGEQRSSPSLINAASRFDFNDLYVGAFMDHSNPEGEPAEERRTLNAEIRPNYQPATSGPQTDSMLRATADGEPAEERRTLNAEIRPNYQPVTSGTQTDPMLRATADGEPAEERRTLNAEIRPNDQPATSGTQTDSMLGATADAETQTDYGDSRHSNASVQCNEPSASSGAPAVESATENEEASRDASIIIDMVVEMEPAEPYSDGFLRENDRVARAVADHHRTGVARGKSPANFSLMKPTSIAAATGSRSRSRCNF